MTDYMADYREAQASGHHIDCDGYRTAHRVTIERERTTGKVSPYLYRAVCEECGPLGVGSSSSEASARSIASVANHSSEVRCDGRCREWEQAA